jgi:hypothetical protein
LRPGNRKAEEMLGFSQRRQVAKGARKKPGTPSARFNRRELEYGLLILVSTRCQGVGWDSCFLVSSLLPRQLSNPSITLERLAASPHRL